MEVPGDPVPMSGVRGSISKRIPKTLSNAARAISCHLHFIKNLYLGGLRLWTPCATLHCLGRFFLTQTRPRQVRIGGDPGRTDIPENRDNPECQFTPLHHHTRQWRSAAPYSVDLQSAKHCVFMKMKGNSMVAGWWLVGGWVVVGSWSGRGWVSLGRLSLKPADYFSILGKRTCGELRGGPRSLSWLDRDAKMEVPGVSRWAAPLDPMRNTSLLRALLFEQNTP